MNEHEIIMRRSRMYDGDDAKELELSKADRYAKEKHDDYTINWIVRKYDTCGLGWPAAEIEDYFTKWHKALDRFKELVNKHDFPEPTIINNFEAVRDNKTLTDFSPKKLKESDEP